MIFSSLNVCLLPGLAVKALALPHSPSPLNPRNDTSPIPATPGIATTILSPTGLDITSNFRILLYQAPPTTFSDLIGRQGSVARPLNTCKSATATFALSHCLHRADMRGSMRRYVIYCHEPSAQGSHPRVPLAETGMCDDYEVCANGRSGHRGARAMASCIGKRYFDEVKQHDRAEWKQSERLRSLDGSMASAVLSRVDGQTPLSVDSLEVDSGVVTEVGKGKRVQSQQSCRDCFELTTPDLKRDTDFLKTQATLITGAAAGVLWLTVLSG